MANNIELERFLNQNPEYKLLSTLEQSDIDIINWAIGEKYISPRFAYTEDRVYTKHDLTVAKMWAEKVGYYKTDENKH